MSIWKKGICAVLVFCMIMICFSHTYTGMAAEVVLNYQEIMLEVGETATLKLTGTEAVSFKSAKASIVTVSKEGIITAKAKGKTSVTVKGKDGKSYKCTVYVVGKGKADQSLCISRENSMKATNNTSSCNRYDYQYDYAGRLLEEKESKDNYSYTKQYTYYSNGVMKTYFEISCQTKDSGEQDISETRYFYSKAGVLERYEDYHCGYLNEMTDYSTGAWYDSEEFDSLEYKKNCDAKGQVQSEEYWDGDELRYQFQYNEDGTVKEFLSYGYGANSNQVISSTVFEFDDKKSLIHEKTVTNINGYVKEYEKKYDEHRNLVYDCSINSDGKVNGKEWTYRYDSAGRLVSCVEYSVKNGKKSWVTSVTKKYDKNGKLIENIEKEKNGLCKELKYVNSYNSKNILIKQLIYADGVLEVEKKWDSKGNWLSDYTYDAEGNVVAGFASVYDKKGNPTKYTQISTDWSGKKTTTETDYINTYDDKGRLLSKVSGRNCNFYTYDEKGNPATEIWISYLEFGQKDPVWTSTTTNYNYVTLREMFTK